MDLRVISKWYITTFPLTFSFMPEHVNQLTLSAQRYCDVPFAPYRFVPGRHPHPTAHPEGHSYLPPGESEPPVPFVPPERWWESEAYLEGVDCYNHGFWWEAHEAWEGLWHVVPNPSSQRSFLQGAIQVSALHLQAFLGKRNGIIRLHDSSRRHFANVDVPDDGAFMGVALVDWLTEVDRYVELLLGNDPVRHEPGQFPYLVLQTDGR